MKTPPSARSTRLVMLAASLLLAGCGAGNLPDLAAFATHTSAMYDTFEATYRVTHDLIDSAPLTPELQELHRQLAREEEQLEETWQPLQESLRHAVEYARTLASLVHDRRRHDPETLKRDLIRSVEGMLGPIGALTMPLLEVPAGHEFARIAHQIRRARRIRRTMKELRRTLRVIHPAIERLVHELDDDFHTLQDWTHRTLELLHEQNRRMHAEEVRLAHSLQQRERLVLGQLDLLARHGQLRAEVELGLAPHLARHYLRGHHHLVPGERASGVARRLQKVREQLHRHHRGFPSGHFVHDLLEDLQELREGSEVLARLESVRAVLEGAPDAAPPDRRVGEADEGSALAERLARLRARRDPDAERSLIQRIEVAVAELEGLVPEQYAHHRDWVPVLGRLEARFEELRQSLYLRLEMETETLRVRVRDALQAGAFPGCRAHGVVVGLRDGILELADLEGPERSGAGSHLRLELLARTEHWLVETLQGLIPAVIDAAGSELAWLRLLATGNPGSAALAPELGAGCREGLRDLPRPLDGDVVEARLGDLRAQYLAARPDLRLIERVAARLQRIRGRSTRVEGRGAVESLLDELHVVDAAVLRLWERAAVLHRVAENDPGLEGVRPLTEDVLEARLDHWREELRAIARDRRMIAHRVEAFEQRFRQLEASRKHVRSLLSHGRRTFLAWERGHMNLASLLGEEHPASHPSMRELASAVADHQQAAAAPPAPSAVTEDPYAVGREDMIEGAATGEPPPASGAEAWEAPDLPAHSGAEDGGWSGYGEDPRDDDRDEEEDS